MRRRDFLALGLLAAPAVLPATGRAATAAAVAQVKMLNEALLKIMTMGHTAPFAARAAVLRPVIQQVFDLEAILRISVGLTWPSFPVADKARLLDVFTSYTVASYVANFDSYNGQTFRILPHERAVGADRIIETELVPKSGDPTRLDYQMRQTPAGWRVVDVLLDGSISRVAVNRSDFRSLLQAGGPAKLITSLQRKVANLQSGTS